MKDWRDNVFFVLVEPREPGNVGASARAMKNMGFRNLDLVDPGWFLTEEARRMACGAANLLEGARTHKRFEDAIRDRSLVIGTTRRIGRKRGVILPLKEGVKRIVTAARRNRVAIVFGREDRGLSNREVEECGFMMTIPADSSAPSLNLSQSVLLVAYELARATDRSAAPELVERVQADQLYRHLRSTLKLLEYIPRGDRDLEARIMRNLKHLFGRAGLTEWELQMLRGICTQIEKKLM